MTVLATELRSRLTPIIEPTPVERLLLAMIRATDYGEVRITIIGGRIDLASHLNTYKGTTLEAAAERGAL